MSKMPDAILWAYIVLIDAYDWSLIMHEKYLIYFLF
jgi:hypothetical protein